MWLLENDSTFPVKSFSPKLIVKQAAIDDQKSTYLATYVPQKSQGVFVDFLS